LFCTKCGVQLAQGSSFCHRCGTVISEQNEPSSSRAADRPDKASLEAERTRLIAEYKSSHNETIAARIRELNAALQPPTKLAKPVAPKAAAVRKLPFSSPKENLKIVGVLLLILIVVKVCTSGPSEQQRAEDKQLEATAVQSVKVNFEPSYEMLSLNPNTSTGMWYAINDEGVHQCVGKCFLVVYSVQVLPTGETAPQRMKFEWLYDTQRSQPIFANTEASTYFEAKQSAP
jgi:zinc ribbon protein